MNLAEISFPVFKLRSTPPETQEGVSYYVSETFNKDTAEYSKKVRFVDDTTIDKPTLSLRRLAMQQQGIELLPISTAIYFLADLVKQSNRKVWWIDSVGKIFCYKKTQKARLKFYPVEQIYPLPGLGAVVVVKGVAQRFKVLFAPRANEAKWAGILEWQLGQKILYGLYPVQHKETWRLI
jgi:hypothetical protein